MRSASLLRVVLTLWAVPTLIGGAAADEILSAPAEKYVGCFERDTSLSARKHIHDPEVLKSSVPEKILMQLIYNDVGSSCAQFLETIPSGNVDLARATERGYYLAKAAAKMALAEGPPPPHVPVTGDDDFTHVEKLEDGALEYLSKECQALFDWDKHAAPASCIEDIRNANRLEAQNDVDESEKLLENPSLRYCLGLPSLDESGPKVVQGSDVDPFAAILNRDAEERAKLRAALDDPLKVALKCVARIRAAGGLVFIDPAHEMARANRIPEVQQAAHQYSKCALDRATEFARESDENAETIARAALGGCSPLREQYLAVLAKGLGIVMTREIAAQEEKETTGALVGKVISARAAKSVPRAVVQ